MYECFHCGAKKVYWRADFSFEEYGYEGEGIVQVCKCANCGADIIYEVPLTDEDVEEVTNGIEVR